MDGMTITEFILARVAEDEEAARSAQGVDEMGDSRTYYSHEGAFRDDWGLWVFHVPPARVLVECGALRRIVEECRDLINSFGDWDAESDSVAMWTDVSRRERSQAHGRLSVIAAIWADHPDYREEWR